MSLYEDFNVERHIMVGIGALEIFVYEDKVLLGSKVSNHGGKLRGINVFKNSRL